MSFIVIEGLDGSGKSTQISLLQEYLTSKGIPFRYLHFPRTGSPVYGDLIGRFLRGELGHLESVNPYLIALIYAGDRKDAKEIITNWLDDDYLVLADRYADSNIAFQCAKIDDQKERQKLKEWIRNLEYVYHKIPAPDLSLFLDVPFEFTRLKLSSPRAGEDRGYLNGQQDIHERSLDFQRKVREVYLEISREDKRFTVIDCGSGDSGILSPGEIFNKIKALLKKRIGIL